MASSDQTTGPWWFIDPAGLEPGSTSWLAAAGVELAITLALPLIAAGLVAPLVALWVERRRG